MGLAAVAAATAAMLFACEAGAFYVPGVAPQTFKQGDLIEVRAIKMTSSHTQLPYEYYSLPFCFPKSGFIEYKPRNLGEILRGDRITNTAYELKMKTASACQAACSHEQLKEVGLSTWSREASTKLHSNIKHQYSVHLIVDNLPCATSFSMPETGKVQYEPGFRLGFTKGDKVYINNHLNFIMSYHSDPEAEDSFRVVGFRVEPASISYKNYGTLAATCTVPTKYEPQEVVPESENKIYFSYQVRWEESKIKWASRWDIYLDMTDAQIHWFSIINSVAIVVFLSAILTTIFVRTLRRDIAKYNTEEDLEENIDPTGWKMVHGDVFRPPQNVHLFVAATGSGTQLCCMIGITIFFAMLGMLSPSSRGSLLTSAIFLYEFMGSVAGYLSGRLYKTLKGKEWRRAAFLTATAYPGFIFALGFFVNFFIWDKQSSGAIPFSTMVAMAAMWFGISFPLVYLGYFFGYRKQPYEQPVRTNQIPRQVPSQPWYTNPVLGAMVAGLLPFGACFIELFFIFSAVYENQFYYLFGFLFLVFVILIISCSQIGIVTVYFQLCAEDYHWWWRSFTYPAGSALYVLLYAIFYFFSNLNINEFVPVLVYMTYTVMMVVTFGLFTGTVGFYSAFLFVRKIYGSVKID